MILDVLPTVAEHEFTLYLNTLHGAKKTRPEGFPGYLGQQNLSKN